MPASTCTAIRLAGAGPPLVFVPGMDGTGQLFYRQVPRLAQDYHVATYGLRDDAPTMDTLVEQLAGVIRLAGGGMPATIVGESFGGTLALSLAIAHPELVARLVVLNSFPRFTPQHRLSLAIAGITVMPWGAMRLVRAATASRLHSRFTHAREMREFLARTAPTTRQGYLSRLRILRTLDLRNRLHEVSAPTLLLASELDHLVPAVEQAELMAARLPCATIRVLKGHGHVCLLAPNIDLSEILGDWREVSADCGVPGS